MKWRQIYFHYLIWCVAQLISSIHQTFSFSSFPQFRFRLGAGPLHFVPSLRWRHQFNSSISLIPFIGWLGAPFIHSIPKLLSCCSWIDWLVLLFALFNKPNQTYLLFKFFHVFALFEFLFNLIHQKLFNCLQSVVVCSLLLFPFSSFTPILFFVFSSSEPANFFKEKLKERVGAPRQLNEFNERKVNWMSWLLPRRGPWAAITEMKSNWLDWLVDWLSWFDWLPSLLRGKQSTNQFIPFINLLFALVPQSPPSTIFHQSAHSKELIEMKDWFDGWAAA